MSFDPIWVARRMRCDSPPDSDAAPRERFRYPIPTLSRKPSRSRISFRIFPAISRSRAVSFSSEKTAIAWPMAPPAAVGTRVGRHVSLQLRTVLGVLHLPEASLDHRDQPLEGRLPVVLPFL